MIYYEHDHQARLTDEKWYYVSVASLYAFRYAYDAAGNPPEADGTLDGAHVWMCVHVPIALAMFVSNTHYKGWLMLHCENRDFDVSLYESGGEWIDFAMTAAQYDESYGGRQIDCP